MPESTAAAQARLNAARDRARRRSLGKPILGTDDELAALAAVGPEDAASGESLWDESQRRFKTGLDGLLSAEVDDGA